MAEDDLISRRVLERTLEDWGHEVIVATDGLAAWEVLCHPDAPPLAILDWMMPGMDGPELCRRVRALNRQEPTYLILLTARTRKEDIAAGLEEGADDYVTKPFNRQELRARLRAGERIVGLQKGLAARVHELEAALSQVKQLHGLLPICMYCKKVRDDQNYWQQVESYVTANADVKFSHGICPPCWQNRVVPEMARAGIPMQATP
jgi:DNA-binding response OmpR family regulator